MQWQLYSNSSQVISTFLKLYRVFCCTNGCTSLKLLIFDPMLVKPKCVLEVANFFDFQKFVYILRCLFMIFQKKILPPLRKILTLSTQDQISIVSEIQPFEISIFQTKHPVIAQHKPETETCNICITIVHQGHYSLDLKALNQA